MTAARVVHVGLAGAAHDITIEAGLLRRLGALVAAVAPGPGALLAVDERIAADHGAEALASLREAGYAVTVAPLVARESRKTLDTVRGIYESMLTAGADGAPPLDRGSPVVALGGGIVGDTAGFAAATFMRGLPLVQAPTTLLAMVDAAIGGKTGVNVQLPDGGLGKNMVGAIWQPRAVLVDPMVLSTLESRELRCGLAECVKHALIADASLLAWLEEQAAAILRLDREVLVALIDRCARIKVAIVEQDERETKGPRALLNLGHSFAHALEARESLGLRHGEAVAIGLVAAARCAARTGRLDADEEQRVSLVLEALGLPRRVPGAVDADELLRTMRYDKKVRAGRQRLVLPRGLGAAEIADDVPADVVRAAWAHVGAAG